MWMTRLAASNVTEIWAQADLRGNSSESFEELDPVVGSSISSH